DVRVTRVDAAALARKAVNEFRSAWIRYGVFPKLVEQGQDQDQSQDQGQVQGQSPDKSQDQAGPYMVETDEKWAAFILKQLLSNALKYSAAAGATEVDIRLSRRPEGVLLEVADK